MFALDDYNISLANDTIFCGLGHATDVTEGYIKRSWMGMNRKPRISYVLYTAKRVIKAVVNLSNSQEKKKQLNIF